MSILSWWRKLFGGPGSNTYYPGGLTPPPFFNCGTKKATEIHDAILENTGQRVWLLGDLKFQVTTFEALKNYAEWWRKQHYWMTYEAEWRDCDDWAAAFHGDISKWPGWSATPNAIVWSPYLGGHAYNCHVAYDDLVSQRLKVYLIEPQAGPGTLGGAIVEEMAPEHFEEFQPWVVMVNGKLGVKP